MKVESLKDEDFNYFDQICFGEDINSNPIIAQTKSKIYAIQSKIESLYWKSVRDNVVSSFKENEQRETNFFLNSQFLLANDAKFIKNELWSHYALQIFFKDQKIEEKSGIIGECQSDNQKLTMLRDYFRTHVSFNFCPNSSLFFGRNPISISIKISYKGFRCNIVSKLFRNFIKVIEPKDVSVNEKSWWWAASLASKDYSRKSRIKAADRPLISGLISSLLNVSYGLSNEIISDKVEKEHLKSLRKVLKKRNFEVIAQSPLKMIAANQFDCDSHFSVLPKEIIAEILNQYVKIFTVKTEKQREFLFPLSMVKS